MLFHFRIYSICYTIKKPLESRQENSEIINPVNLQMYFHIGATSIYLISTNKLMNSKLQQKIRINGYKTNFLEDVI